MLHSPAVHHTIVVTDTESFTDPARTNHDQLAIRHGLYKILRFALARSGVDWSACQIEDRGDGVLVLIPSDVPKIRMATRMLSLLETALGRYNATCPVRASIRLRVAVHAGEVHYDRHGVTGKAINHASHLVEAPLLKAAFHATTGLLAVVVSDWFYDEVIRHYPTAEPDSYHRVGAAWVRLAVDRVCGGQDSAHGDGEVAAAAGGADAEVGRITPFFAQGISPCEVNPAAFRNEFGLPPTVGL